MKQFKCRNTFLTGANEDTVDTNWFSIGFYKFQSYLFIKTMNVSHYQLHIKLCESNNTDCSFITSRMIQNFHIFLLLYFMFHVSLQQL